MKKYFSLLYVVLAASSLIAAASPDDDYAIPFGQLPAVSQNFVKTHFDVASVAYCMRDAHSYEVRFSDASEIEFDYSGKPASIPSHVQANFPSALITKIKVKNWGYELELNNGIELEFNKKGTFLRIDD